MNTLINATVHPIVGILRRSGLLAEDLGYHIIRVTGNLSNFTTKITGRHLVKICGQGSG